MAPMRPADIRAFLEEEVRESIAFDVGPADGDQVIRIFRDQLLHAFGVEHQITPKLPLGLTLIGENITVLTCKAEDQAAMIDWFEAGRETQHPNQPVRTLGMV